MDTAGPILGVLLHAIGGIAAATCYISQKGTKGWSWQSYWIVFCISAWIMMPLVVSLFTTPNLGHVLASTDKGVAMQITLLGAAYGFGGMAFAIAIRYIGFSLTYAIAIGLSAVTGTIVPAVIDGTLVENFQKDGGLLVLIGFIVSIIGVAICGRAGFMKEAEMGSGEGEEVKEFDMKKGLVLVVIAGVLSGIFGVAVARGVSIDQLAIKEGANSLFAGYPKYIFITGGTVITNLIWWGIVAAKAGTLKEFFKVEGENKKYLLLNYLMGIIAGVLWFTQFIFYEVGHANMGEFKFISWGIHMAMLVFFSFGIGLMFKEWNACKKKTLTVLFVGLATLMISFGFITYGTALGDKSASEAGEVVESVGGH